MIESSKFNPSTSLGARVQNSKLWNLADEFITHPLFSGSFVMIVGSNLVNVLNYVYHLIMGRLLGPANYGELAALISFIGLLSTVPASLNLVIIKYVSSAKTETEVFDLIRWLKTKIIKISLIFFFIILISSPFITSFMHISKLIYLMLIATSIFLSLQTLFYRAILQGLLRFKEMILSVLLESSTKLIVSVVLVYLGFRIGGAMLAFVISALLGWYITIYYLKVRTKEKSVKVPDVKSMAFFAIPVIIQSFSTTSLYSADVILVKHFFSSFDAGIYAALSTLGKIIFFGAGPIGAVMFPLVSKRRAKGENYQKIFIYSFLATFLLALTVVLIYWLAPHLAIKFLYGSAYLEAASLLVWFGIFMSLFTLSFLFISYCLSVGKNGAVVLPLIAAISQILFIWFFHQRLYMVILVSIIISALLLLTLFIYSTSWKESFLRKLS